MSTPDPVQAAIAAVEAAAAATRTANTNLYAAATTADEAATAANAQVATLAAQVSALTAQLATATNAEQATEAQLAAADTELSAEETKEAADQTQIAALTATVTADAAEIVTLEAEINPPPPPVENPPSAPTNVVATAGVLSATVTWTASAANGTPVTGYTVTPLSDPSAVVTTGSATTTATFTLPAGVAVDFSVVAGSAAGPSSAATSNTVTPTSPVVVPPPPPPTTAIVNVPSNPSTLLMCTTQETGIHYLPNTTITMAGTPVASGQSGNTAAIGATSWQVIDINGVVVGSGSITGGATTSTITICSAGVWVGGTTAVEGFYTVVCSNGATGSVAINNANSHMWRPPVKGATENGIAAYDGRSSNRDQYAVPQALYTVYPNAQAAATAIIATVKADPYFGGGGAPLDPARPRAVWISSSTQATSPTPAPTAAYWGQLAAALVAGGLPGCWFECFTNEPENGGFTQAAIETDWAAAQAAVSAADPTAKVMGWDSGGIYNNSPIGAVAAFLAAEGSHLWMLSNHMENSHQNMASIDSLREYASGIATQMAASGYPHMGLWSSENGIEGGQYGVLQPRRHARQDTMLLLIWEMFGWPAQWSYDFLVFDHQGANLPMYSIDKLFQGNAGGNMRAGFQATHVFNDALWGTTCTPTSPPAKLSFGPVGSVGDSMFVGAHYTGTANDVVVLGTEGIPSDTVILGTSATGPVTWWDGMGVEHTAANNGGVVTIPVNDLLTYVFLPPGSTVTVLDTGSGAVSLSTATNLALSAAVTNEAGTAEAVVHNGNWGESNDAVTGVITPYTDSGPLPATLTVTLPSAQSIAGFAFKTPGPAWQQAGCAITACTVTIDGVVVWSFTDPTAVSYQIPSPSNANSSDPCTDLTFWQEPYGFVYRLPTPITGTVVKLTVTATGYGGQPTLAASTDATAKYHEGDPQQLQLAEFQVYA